MTVEIRPDIDQEVERYMALPYRIEIILDEGGYVVAIPDLPSCMSQGTTAEEALEMIRDAQKVWLTSALTHGDPIPAPRPEPTYSGKLLLRLPKALHRRLAEGADGDGVSLNQYVVALLAKGDAALSLSGQIDKRLMDIQASLATLGESRDRIDDVDLTKQVGDDASTRMVEKTSVRR